MARHLFSVVLQSLKESWIFIQIHTDEKYVEVSKLKTINIDIIFFSIYWFILGYQNMIVNPQLENAQGFRTQDQTFLINPMSFLN